MGLVWICPAGGGMVAETDGDASALLATSVIVASSHATIAIEAAAARRKNLPFIVQSLQHRSARLPSFPPIQYREQTIPNTKKNKNIRALFAARDSSLLFLLYFSNGTHYIFFTRYCQVFLCAINLRVWYC